MLNSKPEDKITFHLGKLEKKLSFLNSVGILAFPFVLLIALFVSTWAVNSLSGIWDTRKQAASGPGLVFQQGLNGYFGVQDATLHSSNPNQNYSVDPELIVQADSWIESAIRFDLSGLSGARIESAQLDFYLTNKNDTKNFKMKLYKLVRPWVEGEVTWLQAANGDIWKKEGANNTRYDRESSTAAVGTVKNTGAWYSFDITSAVQDWVNNPSSNHGLLMRGNNSSGTEFHFASSDNGVQGLRPKLTVWTAGAVNPTPIPVPIITNVAQGKIVQASAQSYLPASNAVDGVWDSDGKYWATRGANHWIKVDLGQEYQISQIKVGPFGKAGPGEYYYDDAWNIKYAAEAAPNTLLDFVSVSKIAGGGNLTGSGISIAGGNPGTLTSNDLYKYYDFIFDPVYARYIVFAVTKGDRDGDSNLDEIEVYSGISGGIATPTPTSIMYPTSTPRPTTTVSTPTRTPTPTVRPTNTPVPTVVIPTPTSIPSGSWWKPTTDRPIHFHWQIGTVFNSSTDFLPGVTVYDIDGFDNSAATVAAIHAKGYIAICYVDVGGWESGRSDANRFPASVRGNKMAGWPEYYLDIRSQIVRDGMRLRIEEQCKNKGFDAVEPDVIDAYANNSGFPLTYNDQIDYNRFLADTIHSMGMSAGLKGDTDQAMDLQPYFDWTLNEECAAYNECGQLNGFLSANKAVFQVEYTGGTSFCADANAKHRNAQRRNLDLTKGGTRVVCIPDNQNTW